MGAAKVSLVPASGGIRVQLRVLPSRPLISLSLCYLIYKAQYTLTL